MGGKKAFTELKNKMAESNEKMCESKKIVMMVSRYSLKYILFFHYHITIYDLFFLYLLKFGTRSRVSVVM